MTCICGHPITEHNDTALRMVDGSPMTVHRACQEFTPEMDQTGVPADPAP